MTPRELDPRTLTLIAGLRRDAEAVLSDRPEAALRLFRAAWDVYRPNVPEYDWSAHLELPPGELESVHWLLFFAAFMSASWYVQRERHQPEAIRAASAALLTELGCDEDAFGRQFDLLEEIFLAYLRERPLPPEVIRRLCELLYH